MCKTSFARVVSVLIIVSVLSISSTYAKDLGGEPDFGFVNEENTIDTKLDETKSATVLPAKVIINDNDVIKEAYRQILGYNYDWNAHPKLMFIQDDYDYIIDPEYTKMLKEFKMPVPFNRMAGTDSQYFKWKYAIGPYNKRIPHRTRPGAAVEKQYMGPVEWIKSVLELDANAQFTWSLNMVLDTAQDHADLAEFLTGDGTENINGGENWAQKRIAYGLKEPVNVAIWELGNELDLTSLYKDIFPTPYEYVKACKEAIDAIRSVDPNAKFAASATSSPWGQGSADGRDWKEWHRVILTEIGDEIDYIVFHPYYLGLSIDKMERYLDEIYEDIVSITGSDRIKFYLSEHALWPNEEEGKEWREVWYKTHALMGVLGAGEFLIRMNSRKDVFAAAYHSFHAGPWGIMYRDSETGKHYLTGIADLMKVLNDAWGKEVVNLQISGELTDKTKSDCTLTANAMTTDTGLNIILINREEGAKRAIDFSFNNRYKLIKETKITADSMLDFNTVDKKAIRTTTKTVSVDNFRQYTLDEKSLVVLTLERIEGKGDDISLPKDTLALFVGNPYAVHGGEKQLIDADNPDVVPVIENGRTLVPVRFIAENFGAQVVWNEALQTVEIQRENRLIVLQIGKNTFTVDDAEHVLDVPPQIINGRTVIPLRAVLEVLDMQVHWDESGLILISSEKDAFEQFDSPAADKNVINDLIKAFQTKGY